MAFDITTAQPVNSKFDISTAKPVLKAKTYARGERSLIGNIFERPGAAVRSGLISLTKGEGFIPGYVKGATIPEEVPRFADMARKLQREKVIDTASKRTGILSPTKPIGRGLVMAESVLQGIPATTAGYVADIITNPADILSLVAGKLPLGASKTLGGTLAKTAPAKALKSFMTKERSLEPVAQKIGQVVKTPITKVTKAIEYKDPLELLPAPIKKGIRKYVSKRQPYTEREIQNLALTPEERLATLTKQAKAKYEVPLKQEEESFKTSEEILSELRKSTEKSYTTLLKQEKELLKSKIDNLTSKLEKETTPLKANIETTAQKSALEGKRRFGGFAKENSESYEAIRNTISDELIREGKSPTKSILQDIFDKTDDEIAKTFIDTGAPLAKYNALKDKYLGGFLSETNPEAQALAKGLGIKKGQLKNAGIDWSRVNVEQSGISLPTEGETINFKEFMTDVRAVSKAMTSKAKGAEKAFTDEDIINAIFQKNIGEYVAKEVPKFAKLQKQYSPIIEQMKAGRKIFKPGAPYDLETAPKILQSPDIAEQRLINELESGTQGFSKGIGNISQPITKAQQKFAGVEKGFEIAKEKVSNISLNKQKILENELQSKIAKLDLSQGKITKESLQKQIALKKSLESRMKTLQARQEKVSLIKPRQAILAKERKAVTGGGLIAYIDYLMRSLSTRAVGRTLR